MACRHLYETAFDSAVTCPPDDSDLRDLAAETSRRLCSPDPSVKASPACSRSSSDSDRSRHSALRSPALPSFKKLFSACGKRNSSSPNELATPPISPKEDKGKTFSPSVEFKKLDVADETNCNLPLNSSTRNCLNDNATSSSTDSLQNCFEGASAATTCNQESFKNANLSRNRIPMWDLSLSPSLQRFNNNEFDVNHLSSSTGISAFPISSKRKDDAEATTSLPLCNTGDVNKRSSFDCNSGARSQLWLDFSRAPKRARHHLCLDSGALSGQEEEEPTTFLLKQEWYHGSISRAEAENLLRVMKKGSFLVRCSEKLKRQYLLSLKSSRGVMHVKIVHLPSGRFVLSPTSQTFDSIPQLVQHFRTHVLSIRDVSVYLTHPVPEKLL